MVFSYQIVNIGFQARVALGTPGRPKIHQKQCFFRCFRSQKNNERSTRQKSAFLTSFWDFRSILGSILDARGRLFGVILVRRTMHAFSIVFSLLFALFSQFQHILKNTADMQGSLQNAWFWKGGKWQQDVQQHAEIVIDFSTENGPKMNKVRLKTTVAAKIAKKTLLPTQISSKNRFWDKFWLALGVQSDPRMEQKGIKKATLLRLAARRGILRTPRCSKNRFLRPF